MSQPKESRVFILGAGCSAECCYPLGTGFAAELEKFLTEVPDECTIVKESVTDTLKLLVGLPQIETLDQLAKHLENEVEAWRLRPGDRPYDGNALVEKMAVSQQQIRKAKIATSAMFLAREGSARRMPAFQKYKQLIVQIFGGYPWQEAVKEADCHVLTFNYDRLFEAAFLECFRDFASSGAYLYGQDVLNSGLTPDAGRIRKVEPVPDRFCFLKLHGSAGWGARIALDSNEREYSPTVPLKVMGLVEIEKSIPKEPDSPRKWEPLITFPHERQASQQHRKENDKSSGHRWAPYIAAIWEHAAGLLETAVEIRVIGYSFSPIDSRHVVNELFSKTQCDKIVIQNKDVESVRKNLASYKILRGRLEFDPVPF